MVPTTDLAERQKLDARVAYERDTIHTEIPSISIQVLYELISERVDRSQEVYDGRNQLRTK